MVDLLHSGRASHGAGLLPQHLAGQFRLPETVTDEVAGEGQVWTDWAIYACYLVPGAIVGGVFGWFAIGIVNLVLGWFFAGFNRLFDQATVLYGRIVAKLLRLSVIVLVVYGGLLFMTYWGMTNAPVGFIPQQDQGYLLVNVQLPDASSLERTEDVMRRAELIAKQTKGVKHTVAIAGQSLLLGANAPNFGSMYVMLDDFDDRTTEDLTGDSISARLQKDHQPRDKERHRQHLRASPVGGLWYRRRIQDEMSSKTAPISASMCSRTSPPTSSSRGQDSASTSPACSPASAPIPLDLSRHRPPAG